MDEGLGRRVDIDFRDKAYPMTAVLEAPEPERRYRYWYPSGAWWDQGRTGTCVGHAWGHWVEDGPVTHRGQEHVVDPIEIYLACTKIDPWPGNDNGDLNFGTSVRAGAKVLQSQGIITEYRWAWDIDTVVKALLTTGPLVVGSYWYSGMYSLEDGFWLRPTGSRVGGHAYVLNGINLDRDLIRIKNSWGRGWGRDGYGYISISDMESLVTDSGEACLAVELG